MKVLMVPTYYGGISWWRFEVPARALQTAGHEVTCPTSYQMEVGIKEMGTFKGWLNREMPLHDIVHMGYSHVMDGVKAAFELRDIHKVPIVTDIDDDVDQVPPYNSGWRSFKPGGPGQRIVRTQLAHSDGISFSTKPLAEALGYLAPDKPSTVLENWIDVDAWDLPAQAGRHNDTSIRVMVTGGPGRYGDWEIIKEPLEWVMAHYDGQEGRPLVRLFFLGGTPDWVGKWMPSLDDPLANRCFYLQPTHDVQLFNKMVKYVSPDIILSPVTTNTFNKSKSGLKWLEASLAGAAFVCTDWPTYDVAPKGTCLKVTNTHMQWKESIGALIDNPTMRHDMIIRARDVILDSCTSNLYTTQRVDFYKEVIDAGCRSSLGRGHHDHPQPTG